jgi:hypothetical protein
MYFLEEERENKKKKKKWLLVTNFPSTANTRRTSRKWTGQCF